MNKEKKHKLIRIRLSHNPAKSSTTPLTLSQSPLKQKEKQLLDQSLQNDFIFESGDPRDFLKAPIHSPSLPSSKPPAPQILILPKKQEISKDRVDLPSASSTKRESLLKRRLTMRHAFIGIVDREIQLCTQVDQIKRRIEASKLTEQKQLSSLTHRDKISLLKEEKSLRNFDKARKKWTQIENGLSRIVNKSEEMLISHRAQSAQEIKRPQRPEADLGWSSMLRQDERTMKTERFLPVGSTLSGLYLRDVHTSSDVRHTRTVSCPELKVAGQSKLPMEIDAVKNTKHKLLPKEEEKCRDEIIVENYDFKHRLFNAS
jgi:hypothetical protein